MITRSSSLTRPVALDRRQRHLRLEHRVVLLACPLHVLLPRSLRFLGAGPHLSHLSHFRGPAQIPRNQINPVLLWSAVKLAGSRRPVGKVGETHGVFPGLTIGDCARAVRRGSAPPTVHKFTAPARHRVRQPVPSLSLIGRDKPHLVCASRAPDADAGDYTS